MMDEKVPKTKLVLTLLLLLIIPSFSALLRSGYFPMHDDMQAMRLLQMDKCVKDGQIPCRWVPDMGYGYGYPQFNYYAPLPYYAMEAFHLLGLGYLDSVKAGFVASVLVSALSMFLLGKSLWGTAGGFIAALFYIYVPYRAVDMYVRGAVGEIWAFGFLPLILWSSREILKGSRKARLWLALSLAGLFTSHNITGLIFIPVFIAWIGFLYFFFSDSPIPRLKKGLRDTIIATLWGFAISGFYLLPAWFERNFVHIETLLQGYFDYHTHFVSLGQLLFSTYWNYGVSEIGPFDEISLSAGILHWTLPIFVFLFSIILKKKKELRLLAFFLIIGWAGLFFSHQRSVWIWNKLSILAFLQFPWRFLILAVFAFSATAGGLTALFKKKSRYKVVIAVLPILFLFYASHFKPMTWLNLTDEGKFSGDLWKKQLTISIYDYLPIYAKHPPAEEAPNLPLITEGNAETIAEKKGTNWQTWEIRVVSEGAEIRLPLYYFPGWKVWVDEEEAPISYDNELGLITLSATAGEHEISAALTDTPIRRIGNLFSLAGLVAIPIFLKKEKEKK
jgi:hypothetical protein